MNEVTEVAYEIPTLVEQRRGCGYRKPGGLYLRTDGPGASCGKLPILLNSCPTCGSGIKQSRGWTWIDSDKLLATEHCIDPLRCESCPLGQAMGRVGLLWIGRQFYKTWQDFQLEAGLYGISRRIKSVPKGFVVGEHWIWLAHPEVVPNPTPMVEGQEYYQAMLPGVFSVFKPTRIEYVVKGDETPEKIEDLLKRGLTPVKVVPA